MNRWTFAARHGRAWHRPLCYSLSVVAYLRAGRPPCCSVAASGTFFLGK
jgi:hypothetical protein